MKFDDGFFGIPDPFSISPTFYAGNDAAQNAFNQGLIEDLERIEAEELQQRGITAQKSAAEDFGAPDNTAESGVADDLWWLNSESATPASQLDESASLSDPLGYGNDFLGDPLGYGDTTLSDPFVNEGASLSDPFGYGGDFLDDPLGYAGDCLGDPLGYGSASFDDPLGYGSNSLSDPFLNNIYSGGDSLSDPFLNNIYSGGDPYLGDPLGYGGDPYLGDPFTDTDATNISDDFLDGLLG